MYVTKRTFVPIPRTLSYQGQAGQSPSPTNKKSPSLPDLFSVISPVVPTTPEFENQAWRNHMQIIAEVLLARSRVSPLSRCTGSYVIYGSPVMPGALFKEGAESLRAVICHQMMVAAGLRQTVPPSVEGPAVIDAGNASEEGSDNETKKIILVEKGLVQKKVENIFIGPNPNNPLDLHFGDPIAIGQFFNRIDFASFVEAFMATILLRPEDGKVMNLGDSNILFEIIDPSKPDHSPLRPVIIDLDESIPDTNGYCTMSILRDDGRVVIKNGLMGFPQVNFPLEPAHIDSIASVIGKQHAILRVMKSYIENETLTEAHEEALLEVFQRMDEYISSATPNKTLKDLFFHVFPHYQKQWESLDDFHTEAEKLLGTPENETKPMSPILKASYIGRATLTEIKNIIVGRAQRLAQSKTKL